MPLPRVNIGKLPPLSLPQNPEQKSRLNKGLHVPELFPVLII